jgi:hypothetical protein
MDMTRSLAVTLAVLATLAVAAVAQASTKNAIQPGRTFFNTVLSGHHPTKTLVLHNGTGSTQPLIEMDIKGGHGHAFNVAGGTCLKHPTGGGVPVPIDHLAAGARCTIVVRVKTTVPGWWRSVLAVGHDTPSPWTAGLEAHVVSNTN